MAKLAGVPDSVIERAKELVAELTDADISKNAREIAKLSKNATKKKAKKLDDVDLEQLSIFDAVKDDDIIDELRNADLTNMTPLDALNTLYKLQNKIKNRWKYQE